MTTNTEDIFFYAFFLLLFFTVISWLAFSQLTMRPIEKRMKTDGIPNSFSWDGVGIRVMSYAFAIVFPEKYALRLNRLIDAAVVRRYAHKPDWWRGLVFLMTSYTWLILTFIGVALGYSE